MSDTHQAPAETTTALATREARQAVGMAPTGGGAQLAVANLADMVSFAQVMAGAGVAVPKHCRGQPGVCLAVLTQALRWEMDPFAVANKSYSVNDRLAYEAQLVAAVVNTRAPIARRPDYAYDGEGQTRRCTVSVEMLDGSTKVYTSPANRDIKTKNSPLWVADLDQQLGYFAIRSWARRYAPEVVLGVYTPEELANGRVGHNGGPPLVLESGFSVQQAPVGEDVVDATFETDEPQPETAQ